MTTLALLLTILSADPWGAGNHEREITVDGRERSYYVYVPESYRPDQPTPVVLVFHGAATNGRLMAEISGMSKKADEAGFVAVYPNGLGLGKAMLVFNVGGIAAGALKDPADDVEFTRRLLADLAERINVDQRRIFSTGYSNGGMMSYRLAAELSDRIAAIAPVGGTVDLKDPRPGRAVSVMHFHGTKDTLVPWGGSGKNTSRVVRFPSVAGAVETWARLNGCQTKPQRSSMPDTADDGTTVERWDYGAGRDGAEVVLFKIDEGGHTWPGQKPMIDFLGKSTYDISANDLMWEFFQRHPLPAETK